MKIKIKRGTTKKKAQNDNITILVKQIAQYITEMSRI